MTYESAEGGVKSHSLVPSDTKAHNHAPSEIDYARARPQIFQKTFVIEDPVRKRTVHEYVPQDSKCYKILVPGIEANKKTVVLVTRDLLQAIALRTSSWR